MAQPYTDQGKYEQAEPLFRRALTIRQQCLSPQHSDVAETLHYFAHLYQLQQENTKALMLYQQALAIYELSLGPQHPKTNETCIAYIHLLQEAGRVEESATVEAQVGTSELSSL